VLSALTAILSNLVSNVPAVMVLRPFINGLRDPQQAWLTVAMASTFAGNLTVLGSIANLIVVQRAAASGVGIGLWDYWRVGVPLTLLTLLIGTLCCGSNQHLSNGAGARRAVSSSLARRAEFSVG
jgi:Na+/H+ antiporter NhaD/arsenite permease-like protein